MEEKVTSKLGHQSKFNSLRALQITKISLLVFSLGICLVGKRESTWPIINWALYSGYSARFRTPEPSVSAVELRVYTTTGELYTVKPEQILSIPYDSLSHSIVEQAFSDTDASVRDASRKYLMNAVANFVDANLEIKTIQAWKLSYQVEPLEVPPIQIETPIDRVMLGSFSEADLVKSNREKNGSS